MNRHMGQVVCAVAVAAALLAVPTGARAGYTSGFEALSASPTGVILTGQDGYTLPSGTDFNVYTYAGNAPGFPANPLGGAQFIAGTGPGGGVYARAERSVDYSTASLWTLSFDVAAKYLGDPQATPGNNVGSISLQPSASSTSTIALARWSTPGVSWQADYVWYDAAGTSITESVPDPGFQNLQLDHWYNWATTFDLASNQIVKVSITDLSTNTTASYSPTDRYLQTGSAHSMPDPTAFRFFAGGGNPGGNTMAFDNIQIEPPPPSGDIPEPATMALLGLAVTGLGG